MVFTLKEYMKRYQDTTFRDFVREIFDKYTILFLGYGFGEFELIGYLLRETGSTPQVLRHFTVQGLYRGDERMLRFEQLYYRQMGIEVRAYQKDEKGYEQLIHVIREWAKRINQVSNYLHTTFDEIDHILRGDSTAGADKLFQLIHDDKPLAHYTLRKLVESERAVDWFIPFKDRDHFAGRHNPKAEEVEGQPGSYRIPLWRVLPFLEKVAKRNKEKPTGEITEALIEIVEGIIGYRDSEGKRVANYRTDGYMAKIMFLLPAEKWKPEYIDFIGSAGESEFGADLTDIAVQENVLPALIENNKRALVLRMLEVMFRYKETKKGAFTDIEPNMKNFWLQDALRKNKGGIIELCGVDAAVVAIEKLKELAKGRERDFLNIAVPTVEESSLRIVDDDFELQLVDFVRDVLAECDGESTRIVVRQLLEEGNAAILKRIAIHTINQRYGELSDLFWAYEGNLWEEAQHEGYELLKAHCKELGEAEIKEVIEWVEAIEYPESDKYDREEKEAHQKKEMLSALLESKDGQILELYKKYDAIAPGPLDHPGYPFWGEFGEVRHISPVEMEELATWENAEIAKYLREYKVEDTREWRLEQISAEGLRNCLIQACKETPKKFASDMKPFLDVPATYQSAILRGLNEAWNARKEFEVKGVLEFAEQVVGQKTLWEKKVEEGEFDYGAWVVSQITEFVENGMRSDEHAFEAELLPQVKKILDMLAEKAPSHIREDRRVVDAVLSSPRADVFSAMVLYALRYARVYKKKENERWPEGMKEDFTRRLDKDSEPAPDFVLTLMQYLPNIAYLDEEWLFGHLDQIFPLDDDERWAIVFEGYLGYSARIYEKMYKKLREKGHYAKAVDGAIREKYAREKLIQHIAVAFIEGWEEVENEESLINLLLKKKAIDDLHEIVGFLLTIKEGGDSRKKLEAKIKGLWKTMFAVLEPEQERKECQSVISHLGLWLKIVPKIDDEIKEWAKLSAKYAGVGWRGEMLVEHLAKHAKGTPGHVGEIYVEMLEGGTCSDYRQDRITDIVRSLYTGGAEEHANRICNLYGEMGYYFLREIYQENNEVK
jgi:hypothetical protein